MRDVIPPPSRDLVLNRYREAIRSGQTVRWKEISVYPAGRKVGEVAVTPVYDANSVATHLIGIVHDITEREQLEELLRTRRDEAHSRELELLTETATEGVVSVDAKGTIRTANLAFQAMFGWSEDELIGQPVEVLMPSVSRNMHEQHRMNYFAKPHPRLMGGGLQLMGQRKDGSTFPIEVSLNHVPIPGGDRAFAFVTDITQRKQMEEALSDLSQKLIQSQEQERARIGRELHDDVNQRLAMLAIALQQLEDDPSDVQKHLRALRKEVVGLSRDVQALSHELHPSRLEYLGVVAGRRSWCREFGEWQRVEVHFESDASASLPFEIGLCLFRVVQEALHNAVKHSGARHINVALHQGIGAIHLTIRDSGRGFEMEATALGKGVGLASMQERVRLVNGTISIRSQPGGGTSIDVRVPLESKHEARRAEAS